MLEKSGWPTQAPEKKETVSGQTSQSQTVSGQESVDSAVSGQASAYQPNYKFVAGKKEYEIPEMYRGLIKDADTEKQIKEIFEKAHGIDFVKSERARLQEEYKGYRGQTEPIMQIAQKLEYHRQKGDLTSYFQTLGLNKQDVWKWALQQAELENLPQDQKAVYDQHRAAEQRAWELEQQLQAQQSQFQQFQVSQRSAELDQHLSTPEMVAIQQAYDSRKSPDAPTFKQELILRGQTYWHTRQQDVPPAQLVNEMKQMFGHLVQSSPQAQPQVAAQMQTQSQVQAPKTVPVIPNTGSGHVSPTAKKPSSMEDWKKIYQEKYG